MLRISSCLRKWSKLSVGGLSVFSTQTSTLTPRLDVSLHRSRRVLTSATWQFSREPRARFLSLSASSKGDADPPDSHTISPGRERFGSLSESIASRRSFKKSSPDFLDLRHREDAAEEKDGGEDPGQAFRKTGRRNTAYWYFLQCKKLIKEKKLQEALELFSRDMLQGERLQPEEYNYSVLIGGCGRAGQLKKAFRLYNDMKKRGLQASDATYTALFNACAESSAKQAGLHQALKLEQELRRKHYPLSTITYHALLKTHAVTNHLQACIHTLREMLQNGHAVTQETFHYLLMGCLKDKEAGFRLTLQVWRQMLNSGILPDAKNYNLLLRAARDCGIGDPAVASKVLLKFDCGRQKERENVSEASCKATMDIDFMETQLFIQPDLDSNGKQGGRHSEEEDHTSLIPVRETENTPLPVDLAAWSAAPNLLDFFEGKRGSMISLGSVDGASDRLALIGGAKGVLGKMAANRLSPDLKTLTLLADTMEPSSESLQELLKVAKQHQLKLDVAFFNSVIRRTARGGSLENAKAVLSVMRQRNMNVDIQTFGCLALACDQQKEGLQLLQDIQDAGLKPNVHVFSALIGRAIRRLDYVYLKTLLKRMHDMGVCPNEVIIRQLEFAAQYPPNYNQYKSRNNYLVHIDGFRGYYEQWLQKMPLQSAEEEQLDQQTGMGDTMLNTEAAGGLTRAQRKQKAAARTYNSRHRDEAIRTVSSLQQH